MASSTRLRVLSRMLSRGSAFSSRDTTARSTPARAAASAIVLRRVALGGRPSPMLFLPRRIDRRCRSMRAELAATLQLQGSRSGRCQADGAGHEDLLVDTPKAAAVA